MFQIVSKVFLFSFMCCMLLGCSFQKQNNYCQKLSGVWSGFFNDETGLYPLNTAVKLIVNADKKLFAGRLLVQGSGPMVILGSCDKQKITFYTLPYYPKLCGAISVGRFINKEKLAIDYHFENAMTEAKGEMKVTKTQQLVAQKLKLPVHYIYPKKYTTCH